MNIRIKTLALVAVLVGLGSIYFLPQSAYAATFPVLGTLHAGNRPEAMAVDTQSHMLYIAYESAGQVVGFNGVSGTVSWHSTLGDVATDVQVDSSTHRVFVAATSYQQHKSVLAVLDGATGKLLYTAAIPAGDDAIALDAQRSIVYVSSPDAGNVTVFTFANGWAGAGNTLQAQCTQLHIGPHPQGIVVNSHMGRLYVADIATHVVTVVDETTDKTLATIPVGDTPLQPLKINALSGNIYVVCSSSQEVDVIDGKTNRVIQRIPVSPYPEGIAVNTATGRIYVADEGDHENSQGPHDSGTTITVIDGQTFAPLGTFQVGQAPDGVAADPALHRIYVATEESNAVVEISDSTNIPLQGVAPVNEVQAAHHAIQLLQAATIITLLLMLATFMGATLGALSPRWRARGSLQKSPDGESSRPQQHSLPL